MQTETQKHSVSATALERKHEPENPPAAWVLFSAGLVLLMLAASLLIGWALMRGWVKTRPMDRSILVRGTVSASGIEPLERFPKPNLQLNPHDDLAALRAHEDTELNGYGWVDRKTGVMRIPIERAMELIAKRGLPSRPPNETARTGKSEFELARERAVQP